MMEKMAHVSLIGRRRLEAFSDNMSEQHSCPPTQAAVFQPLIADVETVKQRRPEQTQTQMTPTQPQA